MNRLLAFPLFLVGSLAHAQHVFPEKYFVCNTGPFAQENETIIARISKKKLIEVIINGIDKTLKPKV